MDPPAAFRGGAQPAAPGQLPAVRCSPRAAQQDRVPRVGPRPVDHMRQGQRFSQGDDMRIMEGRH